jgi:hypothetical protein
MCCGLWLLLSNPSSNPSLPSNLLALLDRRVAHDSLFQNVFLRRNHQIDAAEWPPFSQKRLLQFRAGAPFATLTQMSLPQPTRGASLWPLLRMDDFVDIQNVFLRMNHQIDAADWPPFDQKRLLRFGPGAPPCHVDPTELATTTGR